MHDDVMEERRARTKYQERGAVLGSARIDKRFDIGIAWRFVRDRKKSIIGERRVRYLIFVELDIR